MLDYMYHSLLKLALKILLTQYNNTIEDYGGTPTTVTLHACQTSF